MKLINDGKTKTVYDLGSDQVLIVFKDAVTGTEEGVDPGGNCVVGQIAGKGLAALRQSAYFFDLLARHDVPTHCISADLENGTLTAHRALWNGLEFIVRFQAAGSFVRRYGKLVKQGDALGGLTEITLKDDLRGDPLVGDETVVALGIMTSDEVSEAKALVKAAAHVIYDDLQTKGLTLVDIKFECGTVKGGLAIIDDISTDNMRVTLAGESVTADDLLRYTVGK